MARRPTRAGRAMAMPFDFTSLVLEAIVESLPNPALMKKA